MNSIFRFSSIALLLCISLISEGVFAQVPLNSDYAYAGRKRISIDDYNQTIDLVVQPDGKTVLLSASGHIDTFFDLDVTLSRYLSDGSIDLSFGTNGVLKVDYKGMNHSQGIKMELLSDGSLLILGSTYNWSNTLYLPVGLMKVTPDGAVDKTFADEGTLLLDFYGVQEFPTTLTVDPQGRILVGGSTLDTLHGILEAISIGRLLPDGQVDSTFGETGRIVLVPDSGIYSFRHQSGGTMDDILVLPNGQLLVVASKADEDVLNTFFQLLNDDGIIDSITWGQIRMPLGISDEFSDRAIKIEAMPDGRVAFGCRIFTNKERDFVLGIFDPSNGEFSWQEFDFNGQEDILSDFELTKEGGLIAVGQSILSENVSSIYKADNFSIIYFPDFTNWNKNVKEVVRFDEGHQGGAQAVCLVNNEQLVVSGFTYTDTPGEIDVAQLSWKLSELESPLFEGLPLITIGADVQGGNYKVRYALGQTGSFDLLIYDMAGRSIYRGENLAPGSITLSTTEVASGAYLAVLYQGGKRMAEEKFVVY